jgi:copper transport protein
VPGDGAVVGSAPEAVELTFSGTVTAGPGAVQVFAPNGDEVQVGDAHPAQAATIAQRIDADQTGTYGVSYRVSSEDGHVINGSVTFSVGEEGGDGASASRDAAAVSRALQVTFSTARFFEVLALLTVAGGGIFACLVAPGWRPRLLVVASVVLLVSYATSYVVTGAILESTSFGGALAGDVLDATADTPFGRSMLLRAVIALVALGPVLLLRSGARLPQGARIAMAVVFAGLAASLSITGHAVTTEPTWLRMPLDMVHVTAAAVWLGGLVQLGFLAPFARTWTDSILRFSRLAFGCVVVLLLTGAYATYAELGTSLGDLLDSRYGRLVLAKLALYFGTMPLAWNNMSAFVPAIRRRPDDAPRMLRQYVWREFALLVVILALTVWLIATPQPT